MGYFDKYKKDMFPKITDWTSNHDNFRFANDINLYPSKYYYFFHHLSYKITMWSFHILSFFIFLIISLYFLIMNKIYLLGFIFLGLVIYKVFKIFNFIKDNRLNPYKNFYDVFLREY